MHKWEEEVKTLAKAKIFKVLSFLNILKLEELISNEKMSENPCQSKDFRFEKSMTILLKLNFDGKMSEFFA